MSERIDYNYIGRLLWAIGILLFIGSFISADSVGEFDQPVTSSNLSNATLSIIFSIMGLASIISGTIMVVKET